MSSIPVANVITTFASFAAEEVAAAWLPLPAGAAAGEELPQAARVKSIASIRHRDKNLLTFNIWIHPFFFC